MAAYVKSAAPATLTRTAFNAEVALVVAAATNIVGTQVATGAVIDHNKFEYPRTFVEVPFMWSLRRDPYYNGSAVGKPIVIQDSRSPPTAGAAVDQLVDLTAPAVRHQYFVHTLGHIAVPTFTHATAKTPRIRIVSLSLTTAHFVCNPWPLVSQGIESNQQIADALKVQVFRCGTDKLAEKDSGDNTYVTKYSFGSTSLDLSLVGEKQGMTARDTDAAGTATEQSQFVIGSFTSGGLGFQTLTSSATPQQAFQCLTTLEGESLFQNIPLVEGELVLLALTDDGELLNPVTEPTTENSNNLYSSVMPAVGAWGRVRFEADWGV